MGTNETVLEWQLRFLERHSHYDVDVGLLSVAGIYQSLATGRALVTVYPDAAGMSVRACRFTVLP